MPKDFKSITDNFVKRMLSNYSPLKIILFGSCAKGNHGNSSDIDLLIVMDSEGSTRQKANEIDILMSDRKVPMDFIVLTPEQFEFQKEIPGTVVRQAVLEGITLYDKAA